MHYRAEILEDDKIVVRHVQTDRICGTVRQFEAWLADHDGVVRGCQAFNNRGMVLTTVNTLYVSRLMECALFAVALHQEYRHFPDLKGAHWGQQERRIEGRLGCLLADATTAIARGALESANGGASAETKACCADLLAKIYQVFFASRYGAFDPDSRMCEGYFAGPSSTAPRLPFKHAAQLYGLLELRRRFPDAPEPALKRALSWPLELLRDLALELFPTDVPVAI